MIEVEVAYATLEKQVILATKVMPNSTVEDAIRQSGILELFPEINLEQQKVGVFSKVVELTYRLHEGDRVEIYRPLIIDPKEARKKRVIPKAKKPRRYRRE